MSDQTADDRIVTPRVVGVVAFYACVGSAMLALGRKDYPRFHTLLDTGMFLFSGLLALLLWDLGRRLGRPLPKWVAVSFGITSILEFLHDLISIEWTGPFAFISTAGEFLRPATWPPAAYALPLGILASLFLARRVVHVPWFALSLSGAAAALVYLFLHVQRYVEPGWMGISRPSLIIPPFLWIAIGGICWHQRHAARITRPLALSSAILFAASGVMLYSRAPHDTQAMVAHLGKFCGYLALILVLMQTASRDMLHRIQTDEKLTLLNQTLESRVIERTEDLRRTNAALEVEAMERQQAARKAQSHLERLNLLQHITRAIWSRQDLRSLLQILIRNLEDQLPADFCCVCQHLPNDGSNMVLQVGAKSSALALNLALGENATFPTDENGLSRCLQGTLVYEPCLSRIDKPFPQRLAQGGLESAVLVPLMAEEEPFGILVVGRIQPESFVSGECEFLQQLGEHVALAIRQIQLHNRLQVAYDDLRSTQQAILQQERLRALGEMASGVAHDINNALSPVSMYLDLLSGDQSLDTKSQERLGIIRNAVEDVAQTIHRLSEFYRQRPPNQPMALVKLNTTVDQVAELSRARWENMPQERGIVIRLQKDLDESVGSIMGVASELREVLTNLVFNAVDAMPEGGVLTLRTRLVREPLPPKHIVEVVDTGQGMDEETRQRCLEPFFTTKGEHGTGLGLAVVYGIAQRHGADMEIESAAGRGTTVRLVFPAPEEAPKSATAPALASQVPPPHRLLIIDDDPLILKALRESLEADGHSVATADGGEAGVAAFKAERREGRGFEVVITDLGMPNMDGRKVAELIKSMSPNTPVVMLSGWGQQILSEKEPFPYINRVLAKPPKITELRAALRELATGQG